jgi:hypothetical protein
MSSTKMIVRAALAACLLAALAGCGGADSASEALALLGAPAAQDATTAGDTATAPADEATTAIAPASPPVSKFDTSVAVATSRSCLSGGCHETNAALLDEYRQSRMTHVNVKCNACHGTHTGAELGKPKPNLTGYDAASGATGYVVGTDRCLACHEATMGADTHPSRPQSCTGCHTPHVFGAPAG